MQSTSCSSSTLSKGVLQDEAGLLMQLDAIQGTGTIVIISNLRRNTADQLELDFDADTSDIRIAVDHPEAGSTSPPTNYQQTRATQPKEVCWPTNCYLANVQLHSCSVFAIVTARSCTTRLQSARHAPCNTQYDAKHLKPAVVCKHFSAHVL